MPVQESARPPETAGWQIERRSAALEGFLERHQAWVLALWSLAYFAGTALRAHEKPFWYDEILTLLEARQATLSAALRALGDVDWMPPASHVVFYLTDKLAGHGEVAFRIPAMLAFWVFCLCLFFFARRRVSFFFAGMALLLPYASAFQAYSYEARSYAFVLGFCGIALVAWQAATEKTRRAWPLAGLALGIAGAISFQYWGVLIGLPLAGAEAYRDFERRRVDWPIWTAFAAGATPLAAFFTLILHGVKSWTPYKQLRATPLDYLDFFRIEFRVYFAFAIPAALLLAAWFLLSRREKPAGAAQARIPVHEWMAAAILLLTPFAAISIALALPPHDFSNRYAAPAVAGYALLGSFLAARWAGRRSAVGLACVLGALAPFAYLMTQPDHFKSPFRRIPGLERRLQNGPIVMDDLITYLEIWYYTPEQLQPRLIFVRARGGRTSRAVREFPKLGVPVVAYEDFAFPGREFLFYPNRGIGLRRRILKDGGTVETVDPSPRHLLLRAHIAP